MSSACPRCGTAGPPAARFCSRCGLLLHGADGELVQAGRAAHPEPLDVPDGMQPIPGTEALFWRWEAAGGGQRLLGTEPLDVAMFNAGYALAAVQIRIVGMREDGAEVLRTERTCARLERGESCTLEVPSWELKDLVRALRVEFVSAEFAPLE
jgi:hypothetical protein